MTHEEIKEQVHTGIDMIFEKLERMGTDKKGWSLCELGEVADILKDVTESHKNLIKAYHYSGGHSEERY
jgi:hypothetical protein